jgi:hypothetical protein
MEYYGNTDGPLVAQSPPWERGRASDKRRYVDFPPLGTFPFPVPGFRTSERDLPGFLFFFGAFLRCVVRVTTSGVVTLTTPP